MLVVARVFSAPSLAKNIARAPVRSFSARGWGWFRRAQAEAEAEAAAEPAPPQWLGDAPPRAFLELSIDGNEAGRIVFELAEEIVPKTVANFLALCGEGGQPSYYAGKRIGRIMRGACIVGAVDETGGVGQAAGGGMLADENFVLRHTEEGMLTMASTGVNGAGAAFMVTIGPATHFDARNVAFGRVVEGMDLVRQIHDMVHIRGAPVATIDIVACGRA